MRSHPTVGLQCFQIATGFFFIYLPLLSAQLTDLPLGIFASLDLGRGV